MLFNKITRDHNHGHPPIPLRLELPEFVRSLFSGKLRAVTKSEFDTWTQGEGLVHIQAAPWNGHCDLYGAVMKDPGTTNNPPHYDQSRSVYLGRFSRESASRLMSAFEKAWIVSPQSPMEPRKEDGVEKPCITWEKLCATNGAKTDKPNWDIWSPANG